MTPETLSAHFHLSEFLVSETAARHGLDNTPPADVVENLRALAEVMEAVRLILGVPISITSGYRCPELDCMVGGTMRQQDLNDVLRTTKIPAVRDMAASRLRGSRFASNVSSHELGLAADFIAPRFGSPLKVCNAIVGDGIHFDQIIHEYGRWTHLGIKGAGRQQLLTIDTQGTRLGLLDVRT